MTIRFVLADDHRMLREGFRRSLDDEGSKVVGEASDCYQAIRQGAEQRPQVVLMDVTMPNFDGVRGHPQIRARPPTTSGGDAHHARRQDVIAARHPRRGLGLPVKDCSTDEIAEAVRLAAGDRPPCPGLAASMLAEVRRLDEPEVAEAERVVTKREEEVLQLIADGCTTREVAEQLYISQKTVKNHLASIYQKLDARDRTQAVLQAVRMGIIHLD